MKALRRISAAVIGFVFFLAGLLKLMDPVGAGLVVEEYFKFFHTLFLLPTAKVVGIGMAFVECVTGAALLTDAWHRITGIVTGAIIGFFTIITLILWIANPVMDCGCFGEAVHLTHAQSFIKNVVLAGLWTLAFIPLNAPNKATRYRYVGFAISVLSVALFLVHSLRSIPMMDYTPLAPGEEIMQPDDEYLTDAAMLSFCNAEGEYADSLVFGNNLMIASVYDPDKLSEANLDRIETFVVEAREAGFIPLVLAAASPDEPGALVSRPETAGSLYFADRRTLMTLNRSNGGATYISDGEIVAKWGVRYIPDSGTMKELAVTDATAAMAEQTAKPRMRLQAFLLYVFAVMLLF